MYQHFILTRFNVRLGFGKKGIGMIDESWLDHRFKLFNKYCYASVQSQSNQNFKWLVFFDPETPRIFKEKISRYAQWRQFIPVYISGPLGWHDYCNEIVKHLEENTSHLITTRLDNDDAICIDFVQKIQNNFYGQEFEFITFTKGYILDRSKLYLFNYPSNPFVSLIEKLGGDRDFRSAICVKHTEIFSIAKVLQITNQPGWLQVIHGQNISNRIRGIRQPVEKISEAFSIALDPPCQRENKFAFLVDYVSSAVRLPLEMIIINLPDKLKSNVKGILRRLKGDS